MLITAQRELEATLQETVELKVDMSILDDARKALEEAEEMHVRWEGKRKAKEEYMAHKAEEEASCKGKELVRSGGEEDISNGAVHLFDDDTSPTCEAEEEEKELTPTAKLTAKPVPTKQIEFHAMRATPASSPSAHRSMHSMEVVIPMRRKVSRLTADWAILTECTVPSGGRAR